jgi:hypothetical protein
MFTGPEMDSRFRGNDACREEDEPMTPPDPTPDGGRFRRTLIRVMSVQVVTLILLWLLQQRYAR